MQKIVTLTNYVYFPEAMVIWNLSGSRLVCLSLTDFSPLGTLTRMQDMKALMENDI